MDLLALLDQREKNHVHIIRRVLMNGGRMTVSELESVMDLSYNTLTSYLDEIQKIARRLGAGVQINVIDSTIEIDLDNQVPISELVDHYYQEALNVKLLHLLAFSNQMTKPLLSQTLQISQSSVQRRIQHINNHIREFNIEIVANRFVGSELQIRYFLYNLFSKVETMKDEKVSQKTYELALNLQKDIIGYNDLTLLHPIVTWIAIAQQRTTLVLNSRHSFEPSILNNIKKDSVYRAIKKNYNTYFSDVEMFDSELEYLYTYLFVVSMGILDRKDKYAIKIINGDFPLLPIIENINQKTLLQLKKDFSIINDDLMIYEDVVYLLSQMHLQMFIFEGFGVYFDNQTIEKKAVDYMDLYVDTLATRLLHTCADVIEKELSNAAWQLAYYRYQSIVHDLVRRQNKPIIIGLDFRLNYILYRTMTQRLMRFLNVNVIMERVQPHQTYDLVITNYQNVHRTYDSPYIYRIAEFETEYDRRKIMTIIKEIYLARLK